MKNWAIKSLGPMFLTMMVIIDTVATYVLWTNHLMVEENPLMLMALEIGWVYWAVKAIQLVFVGILWKGSFTHRWVKIMVWILAIFYFIVWLQFVVGSLI